jgi:hypothetical protein
MGLAFSSHEQGAPSPAQGAHLGEQLLERLHVTARGGHRRRAPAQALEQAIRLRDAGGPRLARPERRLEVDQVLRRDEPAVAPVQLARTQHEIARPGGDATLVIQVRRGQEDLGGALPVPQPRQVVAGVLVR